ncbi:AraC family transcriptional regulator [Mesorhizobium sp. GbtcB19]|uniref:AraC family transcriptional regulator n=1 Tax=Mesorhizobium sp. GbtcB19 TaxID=2824764 RepID=UPI001C31131D|nr:AraC family transcriptional regulator [Mesorhizobium sp. GbtcB19]
MPFRRRKNTAAIPRTVPAFEHIVTEASDSFLWRLDDYPWERNVWNFHPEYEIHLLRKSSGVVLVGDHIGEFGPGYLTIVGGGLPHDWVTAVQPGELIEGRDIVLQFDPERLRGSSGLLPELRELEPFLERSLRGMVFHGQTALDGAELMERMGEVHGLARFRLFLELLDLLATTDEYALLSSPDFSPLLDAESLDIIQRSLTYLFQHFAEDLKLPEVAQLAGMSESTFSRFFQKNTGNSFSDHVAKLRLWQACKLLADTEIPITDICFQVGYMNISNFNRAFLRKHKMTPSSYRKLSRQRLTLRA